MKTDDPTNDEGGRGHVPVMAAEVMELLNPQAGQLLVDLTVGAGGHTQFFLEATAPTGRVIAADRDKEALALAEQNLADVLDVSERVSYQHGDSRTVLNDLLKRGVAPDAILLDLGVSSMQMDDEERGFSLREDGPLDMRMDASQKITAADIVNRTRPDRLENLLREEGDEHRSRPIVAAIVARRKVRRFRTTGDLRVVIETVLRSKGGRIHPATKTFQALRIATNTELGLLRASIPLALECLAPGGRLAIIAFHSGEDRIVKHDFRAFAKEGWGAVLTPKPLSADRAEIRRNRRSRSARLRGFCKGAEA
jgi:16S rRNA (cytosine1402-N4)-methyltransferase